MKVDIWSDIVCPFCYIGSTQFNSALKNFSHKDDITVVYHSFELDPSAPKHSEDTLHQMLAKKKGMTVQQAKSLNQQVTASAAAEGLHYDLDHAKPINSFDAHRLIHFAAAHGKQVQMFERLYAAYFTEAQNIADVDTLCRLAKEVGLDTKKARAVLVGDDYSQEVHADIAKAAGYGIQGVPFFVIDDTYGISGAQGVPIFSQALQAAWHETHPIKMMGDQTVNVCQDGVC
ncbi:MAG: disulfide bond formation protein DsbA [Candidatus Saccharibacteria bacterium]|nr:disulfide bond formation protein DsbA [Candidatus Saccharibacteria bacterium]